VPGAGATLPPAGRRAELDAPEKRYQGVETAEVSSLKLYEVIRSAGGGEVVEALAREAGVSREQAERALRLLLPDLGRAIRRTAESRTGAPAVHAAMQDERYGRYLEDPEALLEPAAAEDGERVLMEVLDDAQREEIVRGTAAAINADEDRVHKLLPLAATLAMAALGQQLREPSPRIPWFGTHPGDHFDAPLLDVLAALFGHDEKSSDKGR
jgi:Bacterial protein of unknown function (DUF937)